jgi:hypothetical protein
MDIVLKHPVYRPAKKLVAFYDGFVVAENGVVRIPYDGERSIRWAKNCWLNGYNRTIDGVAFKNWYEFEADFRSAQSAENQEGSTIRG